MAVLYLSTQYMLTCRQRRPLFVAEVQSLEFNKMGTCFIELQLKNVSFILHSAAEGSYAPTISLESWTLVWTKDKPFSSWMLLQKMKTYIILKAEIVIKLKNYWKNLIREAQIFYNFQKIVPEKPISWEIFLEKSIL